MTLMMNPQGDNNEENRILTWSKFHSNEALSKLTMEQSFQLQKILMEVKSVFSKAEDISRDKVSRQLIGELSEFSVEVVSAFYAQHKGEVTILKNIVEQGGLKTNIKDILD